MGTLHYEDNRGEAGLQCPAPHYPCDIDAVKWGSWYHIYGPNVIWGDYMIGIHRPLSQGERLRWGAIFGEQLGEPGGLVDY